MNAAEIERLAAMAAGLRSEWKGSPPDTLHSLRKFITTHLADRPFAMTAAQLAYVAALPDTKTPARVLQNGPWRHLTADVPIDRSPASTRSPMPVCVVCGTPWPYHEDRDHTYEEPGFTASAPDVIARARALAFKGTDGGRES